jgi:hypothetical protein
MARLALLAHLPRLRIEGDDLPIGGGILTKFPWEQYDEITTGAFGDWRARYEATEPVFFWTELDLDLPIVRAGRSPTPRLGEYKMPRAAWDAFLPQLELGVIACFHDAMVDPVWAALMLAAPAAGIAPPRGSVTVLGAIDDVHFAPSGMECSLVRIQGDTDQEYLFSPRAAGAAVDDDVVARAASLVEPVSRSLEGPDLGPPLRQLLASTEPALAPSDRLTLTVAALEAMLLPEIRSGLGETFGRRLAHLLGGDGTEAVARDLYRARSASVHGRAAAGAAASLPMVCGERLLAGSIVAAGRALGERGLRMEALRARLDEGPAGLAEASGPLPAGVPPGWAPDERLLIAEPWSSFTATTGVSLDPPEGTLMSWSPLVGLGYEGEPAVSQELGVVIMELTGAEVVSMEHKDVRRDFVRQLAFEDVAVAGLSVGARRAEHLTLDRSQVVPLLRRRDLAVAGLRLDGFDSFTDPELFGWCVFDGGERHRNETALRQSILMGMGRAPERRVTPGRWPAVADAWRLMAEYEDGGAEPEIEAMLGLLRRGHDRSFTPPETRATLLLCLLESLLGRFRAKDEPVQLEGLVAALPGVDPAAAEWFAADGRSFRNAVAHGGWRPDPPEDADADPEHPPLAHLLAIARAGVRECLGVWTARPPQRRRRARPSRLLIDAVAARVAA